MREGTAPELPAGWVWAPLGDLCTSVLYGTSKKSQRSGQVPVLRMGNIQGGRVDWSDLVYTSDSDEISRYRLSPGTLLFNRTNSPDLVGKSAMFRGGRDAIHAGYLIALTFVDGVVGDYINIVLNSPIGRRWAWEVKSDSAGQSNISASKLKRMAVPLPPTEEQVRIVRQYVSISRELRRLGDELDAIAALESEIVAKCTRGWPLQELGPYLVDRTESVGADWRLHPAVGLSSTGEIVGRRQDVGEKTAKSCKIVRNGDIVFNPIRLSIGAIARYTGTSPAIVSPEYRVVTTTADLSPELLVRYLRSAEGRGRLNRKTTGSVRFRVYLKHLRRVQIPVAPRDIQDIAEKTLSTFNGIKAGVNMANEDLGLADLALLARATTGHLVPQDPTAEPASALLGRARKTSSSRVRPRRVARQGDSKAKGQQTGGIVRQDGSSRHPLAKLLQDAGDMGARELWQASRYTRDIDAFYAQLALEVDEGVVQEDRVDQRSRVLRRAP